MKSAIKLTCALVLVFSFITCEKAEKIQSPPSIIIPDAVIQIQKEDLPFLSGSESALEFNIFFNPIIEFHGEAYPVNILSTATIETYYDGETPRMMMEMDEIDYLGDLLGDFGAAIKIEKKETELYAIENTEDAEDTDNETLTVRIEIESDTFIKKSDFEAVIPLNKEIEIFPRIKYDYGALERLVQPSINNVYFRLYIGANKVLEKHEVVRFKSVNEVPFKVKGRGDTDIFHDYTHLFAAYVNEDDPLIDTILKEAMQTGLANRLGIGTDFTFSGYQQKDADGDPSLYVYVQVMAVWSVFLNHNIKYSSITTTSTENQNVYSQYVRTINESFTNKQANCVDGTVLFASVLRKIGIDPVLIIIPGHMFLGFVENLETGELGFLETTMLGNTDVSKHTKDDSILGKLKNWSGLGKTQSSVMWDSFSDAYTAGIYAFYDALEKAEEDEDYYVDLIYISSVREFGIKPIRRN